MIDKLLDDAEPWILGLAGAAYGVVAEAVVRDVPRVGRIGREMTARAVTFVERLKSNQYLGQLITNQAISDQPETSITLLFPDQAAEQPKLQAA